jgi:eukaryotic-like serine/threonine-protein kinase
MACKILRSPRHARREAAVLKRLAHPKIVRLLGVAEPSHLLMEFLEGPTLAQLIRAQPQRRLPVSDALRVAIHVGAALMHVHERGFLHLDVKPSNIIVARGRPVLFDFGTARRRRAGRPRAIIGTDAYMAPEQCRRDALTPAADVFGLGATLHEMLAGGLPFSSDPRDPFPQCRVAPQSIRALRRDVPAALDALVRQCLAADPADRPASLAALLPELHGHIRRGPPMWPAGFAPEGATPREAALAGRAIGGEARAAPSSSAEPWRSPYGGPTHLVHGARRDGPLR